MQARYGFEVKRRVYKVTITSIKDCIYYSVFDSYKTSTLISMSIGKLHTSSIKDAGSQLSHLCLSRIGCSRNYSEHQTRRIFQFYNCNISVKSLDVVIIQESLADAKVSARQQCVYENP